MVIIDRFSSQVHLIRTNVRVTARGVAWLYLKEVVRLHGLPESIVTDRDSKFTSIFWSELQRLIGTKLLMSTSFHPQTDGATERANRSIGQILRTVVANDQRNWAECCPMVEFTINSSTSESTGYAPFGIIYGYMPRINLPTDFNIKYKCIKHFAEQAKWNIMATHDAIIVSESH